MYKQDNPALSDNKRPVRLAWSSGPTGTPVMFIVCLFRAGLNFFNVDSPSKPCDSLSGCFLESQGSNIK